MAITKWSIFRAQDGEANSVPATGDDSSATWIYSLQVNHGESKVRSATGLQLNEAYRGAGRRN